MPDMFFATGIDRLCKWHRALQNIYINGLLPTWRSDFRMNAVEAVEVAYDTKTDKCSGALVMAEVCSCTDQFDKKAL